MSPLDLRRLGAWGHLDSLPIDAARAYARRVDELGYGTLWVPETVGREPFTLLGLLAAETSEIRIGTSIVSIWGHDAQTTRMAAMTLHEATGGRFVLGLGVSHLHLAQKLRGHTFDRPLTRMREYLAAYRAAIYRGPMVEGGSEPPVLIAALRERMLALAATDADGAFPYLVTPERVAWTRGVLDAAAPAGRSSDPGGEHAGRARDRSGRSLAPRPVPTWRRTCAPPPTRPAGWPRDSARPIGRSRPATGSSTRWWPGATSRRCARGWGS